MLASAAFGLASLPSLTCSSCCEAVCSSVSCSFQYSGLYGRVSSLTMTSRSMLSISSMSSADGPLS
jgi:hypothetical protein